MADKRITLYHCFSWDEADYLDGWLQMRISEGLRPVEIGFFSAKFEERHGEKDRRYIILQMYRTIRTMRERRYRKAAGCRFPAA